MKKSLFAIIKRRVFVAFRSFLLEHTMCMFLQWGRTYLPNDAGFPSFGHVARRLA